MPAADRQEAWSLVARIESLGLARWGYENQWGMFGPVPSANTTAADMSASAVARIHEVMIRREWSKR